MTLDELEKRTNRLCEKTAKDIGRMEVFQDEEADCKEKLEEIQEQIEDLKAVKNVFENIIMNQPGLRALEEFITHCIRDVYEDESYEFQIRNEIKHDRLESRLWIGREIAGQMVWAEAAEGHGHGLCELTGALLQIAIVACLEGIAPVALLDDPVARADEYTLEKTSELLRELSKEVQLILTTTKSELVTYATDTYAVGMKDGVAHVLETLAAEAD